MRRKLGKAMYGTRDAAQNWEVEYTEMMKEAKLMQGAYRACVFYYEERNIRAVIHGDGFTALGRSADLDWLRKAIEKKMDVKYKERLVGAARVLNRVAGSMKEGIEYEGDQRHAEIIIRDVVEGEQQRVTTPGVNDDVGTERLCAERSRRGPTTWARIVRIYSLRRKSLVGSCPNQRPEISRRGGGSGDTSRFFLGLRSATSSKSFRIPWLSGRITEFAGCRSTRRSTCGGVGLSGPVVTGSGWSVCAGT
jgi:hypothetical protein